MSEVHGAREPAPEGVDRLRFQFLGDLHADVAPIAPVAMPAAGPTPLPPYVRESDRSTVQQVAYYPGLLGWWRLPVAFPPVVSPPTSLP